MNQYDYIITKPPLDEDTLAHYGIKGMKWRKRKTKKKISSIKKNKNNGKMYSINGKLVSEEEWNENQKANDYARKNINQSKAYLNASKNARTNEEKRALNTAFMNSNDGRYDYLRVNGKFITKKRKHSK